ncbi:hypothetical protein [Bradyrhizobium rifense]|nr:hypothetical protein [Bradyrhizobium rifense]
MKKPKKLTAKQMKKNWDKGAKKRAMKKAADQRAFAKKLGVGKPKK